MQGRERECAALDLVLDRARRGESTATIISGEPGIGKTSLCEYCATRAEDFTVLRASGIESESGIPFAGLSLLLGPLVPHLGQLPEPQRHALAGAFALEEPTPTPSPPLALGVATLGLLAAGADTRPILAIVDDAHWLDPSSIQAIAFAARRLGHESVAVLVAQHSSHGSPVSGEGFSHLSLEGLPAPDATALLQDVVGPGVPDAVVDALLGATRGNPMALIEAAATLSPAVLAGRQPMPDPLPLDGQIGRAHADRIAALPEDTRQALIVLAADETGSLRLLEPALERAGLGLSSFEAAELTGIVQVDAEAAWFRHPLLRSASYHGATSAQRRAAHTVLASAATDAEFHDRAAWHRAASIVGPDETVAALLERVARDAELIGGAVAAAPALERAARLTPPGATRDRRLVDAASAQFLAGRTDEIEGLLDEALLSAVDPLLRANAIRVRALSMAARGGSREAVAMIRAEARAIAPLDVERAALMLCEMAVPSTWSGDGHDALDMAKEASELGSRAGGLAGLLSTDYLAHILVFSGSTEAGTRLLHQVHARWRDRADDTGLMMPGPSIGLLCIEEYAEAEAVARAGRAEALRFGAPAATLFHLGALAEIQFCTGDWMRSYAAAAEMVDLARATGNQPHAGYGLVGQARVEAAQGRRDACEAHVLEAVSTSTSFDSDYLYVYAAGVRGSLELGLGRPGAAYAHLAPLTDWLMTRGWIGMLNKERFGGDLVEAAILVDALEEAERLVSIFEAIAEHADHTGARASMARCRGLLAKDDAAESHFREALTLHARTTTPFEAARTELVFGAWLGERDRTRDALAHLRRAHVTFARLGATPWEQRTRRELRTAGDATVQTSERLLDSLTVHELQVAFVVAEGASNKEAAAALFVSPKTVEFHLGRAYRKLGIRSRAQLTRIVLTDSGIPPRNGPPNAGRQD